MQFGKELEAIDFFSYDFNEPDQNLISLLRSPK